MTKAVSLLVCSYSFRKLALTGLLAAYSVADLILRLTSVPRTSAIKAIILHPVLAAAVDSAWTHETDVALSPQYAPRFTAASANVAVRCLYCLNSTNYFFYVCLTTAIALTPESAHYYRFNPLQPRSNSLNNPILAILFYIWLLSTLGYFVELCKCMVRLQEAAAQRRAHVATGSRSDTLNTPQALTSATTWIALRTSSAQHGIPRNSTTHPFAWTIYHHLNILSALSLGYATFSAQPFRLSYWPPFTQSFRFKTRSITIQKSPRPERTTYSIPTATTILADLPLHSLLGCQWRSGIVGPAFFLHSTFSRQCCSSDRS